MKITVINGCIPDKDMGVAGVLRIISDVLEELGIELEQLYLNALNLPFFSGKTHPEFDRLMSGFRNSAGFIFCTTSFMYGVSGPMARFFEYLSLDMYRSVFREKHCMLLAVSRTGGEWETITYMSRVMNAICAYDTVRIGMDEAKASLALKEEYLHIIERQAEDFYRLIRQNRSFFIPTAEMLDLRLANNEIKPRDTKPKLQIAEVYEKLNLEPVNHQQEQDIADIADYFTQKYDEIPVVDLAENIIEKKEIVVPPPRVLSEDELTPRFRTLRQLTSALAHHFKPQLSHGLDAAIQLQITGKESFTGQFVIKNTECEFIDDAHPNPDITIIADSSIWADVLRSKLTAQKAFMIGKLKVRGNFVLLTRFDQLFDTEGLNARAG